MLVMGGNKLGAIGPTAVLQWYHRQFAEMMIRPNARLMVIGYGFGDAHINRAILAGAETGLGLFVIDPEGADVVNPTRRAAIPTDSPFEPMIVGASRRGLRETFGTDTVEHSKILRFFDH